LEAEGVFSRRLQPKRPDHATGSIGDKLLFEGKKKA